jgi:beta-1,4-mannosyl-glycoprotein beta-1,4-N-acetylglucosaminyltransferase
MNIYDCFMYFDEDMLLDLRLNALDQYVNKFIITESTYMHSGKPKKLNFDIKKFSKFKDKIEHIVIDKLPPGIEEIYEDDSVEIKNKKILDNSLKRENNQRNCLVRGFDKIDENDIILLSDLDEIPNLENFKFRNKLTLFVQKVFYYKFNLMQPNFNWIGTRACKKKHLISPQWLRNIKDKSYPYWRLDTFFSKKKYMNINYIFDGGWHFTCMKNPKSIHFKLSNFMHHLEFEESGLKISDMEKMIKEKKVLYNHMADKRENKYTGKQKLIKVSNDILPKYLKANLLDYKEWLD